MKLLLLISVMLIQGINGCVSTRQNAASDIKAVPLHNYAINGNALLTDSVNYKYFINQQEFREMFDMTKATRETAIVPDFETQRVVAIVLKPTANVISLEIDKAEIAGKTLNIYYNFSDTTSWKSYPHTPTAVATVPKALDIKQVSFYRNNIKEKTLPVSNSVKITSAFQNK